MSFSLWLGFVLVIVPLLIVPGPTVLMITALTLKNGVRALGGLVPGVVLADLTFITVALVGVAALIQTSALLYWGLKLAGLFYVLWLVRGLWTAPTATFPDVRQGQQDHAGLQRAVIPLPALAVQAYATTLTNPKGFVFVFGLIPLFVPEDARLSWAQGLIMTLTFITFSAVNATAWGMLAYGVLGRLARWPHVGKLSALILLAAVAMVWILDLF